MVGVVIGWSAQLVVTLERDLFHPDVGDVYIAVEVADDELQHLCHVTLTQLTVIADFRYVLTDSANAFRGNDAYTVKAFELIHGETPCRK
ncbi:hypothetical protein D3C86_2034400 [compost metagenome]